MKINNKTFWELINEYTINIPIIQRDYAQGREEEKEKRNKFLGSIYNHLLESSPLDLDFVYGKIKETVFFPIDGQQRLTTLFLLHWYFSLKENVNETQKNKLKNFVYDTRISTREFCKALVEEKINLPLEAKDNNFSFEIQEYYWFRSSWAKDPTIKAMLIMIQAIHEKFHNVTENKLWELLTTKRIITFQVLDLGTKGFELTDELYIKMNARGKQLTPFENFKASFIQFLEKTFRNEKLKHPIKGDISYGGYFSYRIEKEWTDLFWSFRKGKDVIDILFMNYFEYVAEMCYFKMNEKAKSDDFKSGLIQYEEIFKEKENLLFLFNSLDKLYEITFDNGSIRHLQIQEFFEKLLQKGEIDEKYDSQVRLFWNASDDVNLFESIIEKGSNEDTRNKIILYCIMYYLIKFDSKEVNNGLKFYIRVIRNLLQATRQKNETKYNTNVRINNFGSYWSLFKQLATENVFQTLQQQINSNGSKISDQALKNERIKANLSLDNDMNSLFLLQEFPVFGGLIHQLKPEDNLDNLSNYSNAVREIWSKQSNDTLIIQALIACGFEGVFIKSCKMGRLWSFGNSQNWDLVLTYLDKDNDDKQQNKISENIILLLDTYIGQSDSTPLKKLNSIRENWLETNQDDRSWRYYFLKYPEFTSDLNYYAWNTDYEVRSLHSVSFNPLLAYHISPYVLTVCKLINDSTICEERNCYQQYSGNSPLKLENGVTLKPKDYGWLIDTNNHILTNEFINKYKLEKKENKYILKETENKDRIEIAVQFSRDMINL